MKKVQAGPDRAEYRDGHTRGLVLRITPNGKKTWAVIYRRKSDARKRRYTIGAYPAFSLEEARNQAQEVLAAVARREDPAGQLQTRNASLTFAQLAAAWVNRHGRPNKVPRALYDDQLMLSREIYPAIGAMKADEVSKRDIIQILDGVADRGARVRSNRVFTLLRSIYRWGLAEDLIKSDPTQGVRPRTVERPRDRVLTDEEVSIFWHSLDGAPMTKAVATILRLALVTGQRIGEIAGMTKAEIDLSATNPMWTQVGARRKNKEMTRVPLSPLAVALISDAIASSSNSPVHVSVSLRRQCDYGSRRHARDWPGATRTWPCPLPRSRSSPNRRHGNGLPRRKPSHHQPRARPHQRDEGNCDWRCVREILF